MRPRSCSWTKTTKSRRRPKGLSLALGAVGVLALAACSPAGPPGVDRKLLDAEVSKVVGDPYTCVLIGKAGTGQLLYRYNSASICDRELAACGADGKALGKTTKVKSLLEATAKDGQPRQLSCTTTTDASRGVGWASGPIEGTDMVYAASMEGERAFPGRMMADRLTAAFRRAKVSKPAP